MTKRFIGNMVFIGIIFMVFTSRVQAGNMDGFKNINNTKPIPIITYHHIIKNDDIIKTKQENNNSILALEEFEKQMKYLNDNNFYVASLDELYAYLNDRINLPEKTVIITFDDGYLSNKVYAYPILKQYNYRASMFVIGEILQYNVYDFDPSKIQFLRGSQLKDMNDVFTYENHTYSMHSADEKGYSKLIRSQPMDIFNDLCNMKELLNTSFLAFPRGQNTDSVIDQIKKTNHKLAFTIAPGYVKKGMDMYRLPRFPISIQDTPFPVFEKIVNGQYKESN